MDCYVFLCRYFVMNEESDFTDEEENENDSYIKDEQVIIKL